MVNLTNIKEIQNHITYIDNHSLGLREHFEKSTLLKAINIFDMAKEVKSLSTTYPNLAITLHNRALVYYVPNQTKINIGTPKTIVKIKSR